MRLTPTWVEWHSEPPPFDTPIAVADQDSQIHVGYLVSHDADGFTIEHSDGMSAFSGAATHWAHVRHLPFVRRALGDE